MSRGRLLIVAIMVATIVAGAPIVSAADSSSGDGPTVVEDPSVSLSELRSGGTNLPEAPRGIRSDGQRLWWLEYWPASAVLGSPGDPTDSWSEYVDRGTTVDRPAVYLRTVVVDGAVEETVNVAYWTTTTQNGTTRLDSLTVERHKIRMGSGTPIEEIPLQSFDDSRQVTVWIDGGPRWRFDYDPTAVAEPIAIDSMGDFLFKASLWFIFPVIIGTTIGGSAAKRAIKKTGMGPGYPIGLWFAGIAFATGLGVLFAFGSISELIGKLPWVLGIVVSLISLIIILESQAVRRRSVEFIRPEISPISGPDGGDQVEVLEVDRQSETVVDMPTGDPAVVRTGLMPFLARAFGAAARIPSLAFETRIDVSDNSDDVDEIIVVDPSADQVLDYSPEGFRIEVPDDWRRTGSILAIAGLIAIAIGAASTPVWGALILAVAVAVVILDPVDGSADVDPAKAHVRSAWISALALARDVDDAHTLESARDKIIELQGTTERDIQQELEREDATLVETMLSSETDRSVDPDDLDLLVEDTPDESDDDESDDPEGSEP